MKRRFQNVFVIALVVSLLLHFGTGIYVFLKPVKPKVNDSIEVTIIDQKKMAEYEREKNLKNDARQIVEQSPLTERDHDLAIAEQLSKLGDMHCERRLNILTAPSYRRPRTAGRQ